MAAIDPRLQQQAILTLNPQSTYRVPIPAAPMVPMADGTDPAAQDPIAQQNAALAAAQAQDAAMSGVGQAPEAYTTGPEPTASVDPMMSPPPPQLSATPYVDPNAVSSGVGVPEESLMSMPADMSYPAPPGASTGSPTPTGTGGPAPRAGGGGYGGGMANPLPGMEKDAAARRADAAQRRDAAKAEADRQQAAYELSTEELASIRGQTADELAANSARTKEGLAEIQRQHDAALDSHIKATEKTEARAREKAKFIGEYEVKDRRPMAQRVMGALAIAFSGIADQANLAATANMGTPVQTNLAGQAASLVERGIDRNLEKQRMMLENKRTELSAIHTELGQAQVKWGNTREALLTAKLSMLDQAEKAAEETKQRGLSAEQTPIADQTIAELRQKKAAIEQELARGDYEKAFADEQRIKLTRYQQQQAAAAARARSAMTPERALKLEHDALTNAKLRQEVEQGPAGAKLNDGQEKLKRDILGAKDDIRRIAGALDSGVPYLGTRGMGSFVPDVGTPEENLMLRSSIDSGNDLSLRDKSGASIGREERSGELEALGVYSSDPEVAKEGLRKLYRRIISRAKSVGVTPEELGVVDPDARDLTRPYSE